MKLKRSKNQGDLDYIIKEEGFTRFIARHNLDILDDSDEKIGEICGYKLKVNAIKEDLNNGGGRDWFISMDGISQLCCWACEYLSENRNLLYDTNKFYFLNRISFNSDYESIPNHQLVLGILMENFGSVLYSLGSTELEDDFPEEPYESFYRDLGEMLLYTGWELNNDFGFYYKKEATEPVNYPNVKGLVKDSLKNKLFFVNLGISEDDISKELGGEYRTSKFNIPSYPYKEYIIYTSHTNNKSIVFQVNKKEEMVDMDIRDAYIFKYQNEMDTQLIDLTDSREEYLQIEKVKWETTVFENEYDTDLFCVNTIFTFTDEEDETVIGKANVTILNQETEPYSLLEAADYISSDLVYSFNGIPVYEDEWELQEKLSRRKRIGVFGKVAIIENFYIQGAICNIRDVEKKALESMIRYFTSIHQVDFIIINPILCDFFEHSLHRADTENKKRLIGASEIKEFLKEELNFVGNDEPTDSLLYAIVDIFEEYEPLIESKKEKYLKKMYAYQGKGDFRSCYEVATEGHEQGISECTFLLGTFYYQGEVVEEDKEKAFEYFFEVAQDGIPEAMYNVGQMYFNGVGNETDVLLGKMWMEKAAAKKYDKAIHFMDRMNEARTNMVSDMANFFKSLS